MNLSFAYVATVCWIKALICLIYTSGTCLPVRQLSSASPQLPTSAAVLRLCSKTTQYMLLLNKSSTVYGKSCKIKTVWVKDKLTCMLVVRMTFLAWVTVTLLQEEGSSLYHKEALAQAATQTREKKR